MINFDAYLTVNVAAVVHCRCDRILELAEVTPCERFEVRFAFSPQVDYNVFIPCQLLFLFFVSSYTVFVFVRCKISDSSCYCFCSNWCARTHFRRGSASIQINFCESFSIVHKLPRIKVSTNKKRVYSCPNVIFWNFSRLKAVRICGAVYPLIRNPLRFAKTEFCGAIRFAKLVRIPSLPCLRTVSPTVQRRFSLNMKCLTTSWCCWDYTASGHLKICAISVQKTSRKSSSWFEVELSVVSFGTSLKLENIQSSIQ